MISFPALLDLMTSTSLAPSTLGQQLNRMLEEQPMCDGKPAKQSKAPLDAQPVGSTKGGGTFNELGAALSYVAQGELHRCYDDLLNNGPSYADCNGQWGNPTTNGPLGVIYPALGHLRLTTRLPMGYLVIAILRLHQEFGVRNPTRGLVRVYRGITKMAPKLFPELPGTEDEQIASLLDANNLVGMKARLSAAEIYADCLLAAENHVKLFNAKKDKR